MISCIERLSLNKQKCEIHFYIKRLTSTFAIWLHSNLRLTKTLFVQPTVLLLLFASISSVILNWRLLTIKNKWNYILCYFQIKVRHSFLQMKYKVWKNNARRLFFFVRKKIEIEECIFWIFWIFSIFKFVEVILGEKVDNTKCFFI